MHKRIILALIFLTTFSFAKININDNMSNFKLSDQFDIIHKVKYKTKQLIFVFEKASGHTMKDFLSKKNLNYLTDKDILFIADVSSIPTVIQWIALHSLKNYPYSVMILNDKKLSLKYKDEKKIEKIMVVTLIDKVVVKIKYFDDIKLFQEYIEND